MDALSAILNTAKKRGVLDYSGGGMLMQGNDDDVVITLLKEDIPDTEVFQSTMIDREVARKAISSPSGPEKCYICEKTVYSTERIAPNSKVMHKNCFKCKECKSLLRLDAYCLNNGNFYCKTDYERLYRELGGGYQF